MGTTVRPHEGLTQPFPGLSRCGASEDGVHRITSLRLALISRSETRPGDANAVSSYWFVRRPPRTCGSPDHDPGIRGQRPLSGRSKRGHPVPEAREPRFRWLPLTQPEQNENDVLRTLWKQRMSQNRQATTHFMSFHDASTASTEATSGTAPSKSTWKKWFVGPCPPPRARAFWMAEVTYRFA